LSAADKDVTWIGVKGTGASINGGVRVPVEALKPVTDAAILAQLPASARTSVRQVELSSLGISNTDVGDLSPHVYPGGQAQIDFYKFTATAAELFWDTVPLHRARFPNGPDQMMIPQNSLIISKVMKSAIPAIGSDAVPSAPALHAFTRVNMTLDNIKADHIDGNVKGRCGKDLNITSCAETLAERCNSIPDCLSFALTMHKSEFASELYRTSHQNLSYNKGWTYWYKPVGPPTPPPPPTPPSPAPTPAPHGMEVVQLRLPTALNETSDSLAARIRQWSHQLSLGRTLYTHGEWANLGWADTHKPLVAVSETNRTITVIKSALSGGMEGSARVGGWLRVYNSLSDLDEPGEYVILAGPNGHKHTPNGHKYTPNGYPLLLVFPPESSRESSSSSNNKTRSAGTRNGGGGAILSTNAGSVVRALNTSGIHFDGIDIEYGRAWGAGEAVLYLSAVILCSHHASRRIIRPGLS
jgi:hypothetical protein